MTEFKAEIIETYSSPLTLDNVRVILRISKRKASWMLQNGYIKCQNNGKKTRQYQIEIDDLLDYIQKVENYNPEIIIPTGLFNARPAATTRTSNTIITPRIIHEKPPEDFSAWLDDKWYKIPMILHTDEVAKITGYNHKTVQEWITQKKLRTVWTQNKLITSKEWLIDFYINEGYKIQNKCRSHIELLIDFYHK